jgi:hypothetical protein
METIFVEGRVAGLSDLSTRIVARRQRSGGFVKTTLTRALLRPRFGLSSIHRGWGNIFV